MMPRLGVLSVVVGLLGPSSMFNLVLILLVGRLALATYVVIELVLWRTVVRTVVLTRRLTLRPSSLLLSDFAGSGAATWGV